MKTLSTRTQVLVALLFFCGLLAAMPLFGQAGDPPGRVARLSYTEGSVSFEPSGESDWSQASLNYPLTTGDRLWTDKGARAELETGNIAVRMAEQTDLTTTNLTDQLYQLGLAQGSLRITAYDLRSGSEVEVDTANAAVTIVQPGSYRVDTYPDQGRTLVTVNRGEVQITGNGINETVRSGQAVMLYGTGTVETQSPVSLPAPDSFDQWCAQRDPRYQNARSRQYVNTYIPGYYDLDQYGSWDTVAAYGPIWYPSGLVVGWCPYRYGRWAWVEPWGWTWVDNAPWGFAPFHYGRWVQIGPRWGWLPGPIGIAPIYGPAFVAFVGGPGFAVGFGVGGVAAWFPLGPGEPFYPWYHHSDGYLRQVNVTNVRNINVTNITNITNVNNIHYRYQTVGATAVSTNTFRNSEPVARNLVKVNPQQLQRAQVIPHPDVNPTPRAIAAGQPTTRPPVQAQRPQIVPHAPVTNRPGQPGTVARTGPPTTTRPNETVQPNANIARTPPPNERNVPQPPANTRPSETVQPNANITRTPPPNERNVPQPPANTRPNETVQPNANITRTPPPNERNVPQPSAGNQRAVPANVPHTPPPANSAVENRGGPPPTPPALVGRTPPPPEKLPYEQKAPAMEQHPGRPLEPQQRENLRTGNPPGPMMDREYPSHPAPPVRAAPPPRAAPAPHGEPPKN